VTVPPPIIYVRENRDLANYHEGHVWSLAYSDEEFDGVGVGDVKTY